MVHVFIEYGIILLYNVPQYNIPHVMYMLYQYMLPFVSPYTKKHFVVLINLYNVLQEK